MGKVWKTVLPKLLDMYNNKKERILMQAKQARQRDRQRELGSIYDSFIAKWVSNADEHNLLPNTFDVALMPEVESLINEDDAQIEMTLDRLDLVAETVLQRTEEHKSTVRRDLVEILDQVEPETDEDENKPSHKEGCTVNGGSADERSIRAVAFWTGTASKMPYPYPEILFTEAVRTKAWVDARKDITNSFRCLRFGRPLRFITVSSVACEILRAVKLSEDISRSALGDQRFLCSCRQGPFAGPRPVGVPFIELVSLCLPNRDCASSVLQVQHIYAELVTNEMASRSYVDLSPSRW